MSKKEEAVEVLINFQVGYMVLSRAGYYVYDFISYTHSYHWYAWYDIKIYFYVMVINNGSAR